MHIAELLAVNARKYPDKHAIITAEGRRSWQQLHQDSLQLAGWLAQQYRIEPGDRVALFMPNGYEWVLGYFAAINLGAIVVPINARLAFDELDYILKDCAAQVLLSLTSQAALDQAEATPPCPVLRLDRLDAEHVPDRPHSVPPMQAEMH